MQQLLMQCGARCVPHTEDVETVMERYMVPGACAAGSAKPAAAAHSRKRHREPLMSVITSLPAYFPPEIVSNADKR
jgi:hypothetical protein